MASKTEIANRALSKLGQGAVTDITTENTTAARTMNEMFDIVRKAVLRDHPWNFAIKRASLAPLASAPVYGWSYQYKVPTDFLRLLEVKDKPQFTLEGNKILTDTGTELLIKYVRDVTDTGEFDDLFVEAFASRLAMEAAERITQSNTKKEDAAGMYKQALADAKSADAQENSPIYLDESDWIKARDAGGNLRSELFDPITS